MYKILNENFFGFFVIFRLLLDVFFIYLEINFLGDFWLVFWYKGVSFIWVLSI